MTKLKYTIIIGLLIFFQNCGNPDIDQEYFVGTWKAEDNATLLLNEDGSVMIKEINISNIFLNKENPIVQIDITGRWEFTTDMYKERVIKINSDEYTFDFYISGKGILENNPPWDLYINIGDPDSMNKYIFIRQ